MLGWQPNKPRATMKYSLTELALAIVLGFPAIPRQIAETMVDFPVPFGPRIKFRLGPGINSTSLYVLNKHVINTTSHYPMYNKTHSNMKSFKWILTIAPFVKAWIFPDDEVLWLRGGIFKLYFIDRKLANRKGIE